MLCRQFRRRPEQSTRSFRIASFVYATKQILLPKTVKIVVINSKCEVHKLRKTLNKISVFINTIYRYMCTCTQLHVI